MDVVLIEFNPESKKYGPRGYGTVYSPIDWTVVVLVVV